MTNNIFNTNANTANTSNTENPMFRTVGEIKAAGYHLLVMRENRVCDLKGKNVKSKKASIKAYGVITPLHLIPAKFPFNEGLTLLDGYGDNANIITDPGIISKSFVIEDGNNRYVAWQELRKEGAGPEDIKVAIEYEPHGRTIERLMEQQKEVCKWSQLDVVRTAAIQSPNDKILEWAREAMEHKMKQSTLSIYLTGTKDGVKMDALYKAGTGSTLPISCNVERAKKIYDTLKKAGFEDKHLNSRYLVQRVYDYNTNGLLEEVLMAFKQLTNTEVKTITDKANWGKEGFLDIIDKKVAGILEAKEATAAVA